MDLVRLIGAGRKTGAGIGVSGSGELGGDTAVEGGRGVGDGSSLGSNAGRLAVGGVIGSCLGGGVDGGVWTRLRDAWRCKVYDDLGCNGNSSHKSRGRDR